MILTRILIPCCFSTGKNSAGAVPRVSEIESGPWECRKWWSGCWFREAIGFTNASAPWSTLGQHWGFFLPQPLKKSWGWDPTHHHSNFQSIKISSLEGCWCSFWKTKMATQRWRLKSFLREEGISFGFLLLHRHWHPWISQKEENEGPKICSQSAKKSSDEFFQWPEAHLAEPWLLDNSPTWIALALNKSASF